MLEAHQFDVFSRKDRVVLGEIPLSKQGAVPAQFKAGIDRGWIWNCIALIYTGHTHPCVQVKLYRPAYQTVQLHAWENTGKVDWKPAGDLDQRIRALDDLLLTDWEQRERNSALAKGEPSRFGDRFPSLAPGSASAEHQKTLLFLAEEYDRLGRDAKANLLRERAKE